MDIRGKWEISHCEDTRRIHLDTELGDIVTNTEGIAAMFAMTSLKANESANNLVESLRGILGLTDVSVGRFHVCLSKSVVYEWEEITPKVERLIEEWHDGKLVLGETRQPSG